MRGQGASYRTIALLLFLFLVGTTDLSCEREERVEPASRGNAPPSIMSVQILPERPVADNDFSLLIQSKDPDGDPISYDYQWLKNDQEIAGENKCFLAKGTFRKGDFFRVRVVASDGKKRGQTFLSPAVQVMNSRPVLQEVSIGPTVAHTNDHLKVSARGFDKDGDSIYYAYQWEINGSSALEERGETLERTPLKKGDTVAVLVTPDDRETLGVPKRSEPVPIVNSPPVIVSSPPASPEGNIYLYQVKATDPDQDPLKFTLKRGPSGMVIDVNTGLLRWEMKAENRGTHVIEIEASDNEGANCIQLYSVTVEIK